jgi:Protein of unknown function (DUF2505)
MPRSFDIVTESSASVEQIHAAFGREDYWLARIEPGATVTTLDSLIVDADGTVRVRVTQHVGRQLLPGPVAKLIASELQMVHSETWRPVGDGQLRGRIAVSASPGLGSGGAEAWLAPLDHGANGCRGSQLRCALKVQVKIPLLGGKFEQTIGDSLAAEGIPEMQRFTAAWIAAHAA